MSFVKVVKEGEIQPGEMKSFNIEGKDILVVNYEGGYYAIDNKCPHMSADLSKGRLEGKIVTCPRHKSQFDITTGKCVAAPKIGFLRLKTKDTANYKVKVENGSIEVEM